LLKNIINHQSFRDNVDISIAESIIKTDNNFLFETYDQDEYSGTTANCVFIRGKRLLIANVGDSRAVLCRNNKVIDLSIDQTPERKDENERITNAGGTITISSEINLSNLYKINPELLNEIKIPQRLANSVGFIDVYRIFGDLSVSRAIGDKPYKGTFKNLFWNKNFKEDLVISTPEINEIELTPDDEFIIMACDGLWDVFSSEEAVDYVKDALSYGFQPKQIVKNLGQEALRLGSQDNVTVIIIFITN